MSADNGKARLAHAGTAQRRWSGRPGKASARILVGLAWLCAVLAAAPATLAAYGQFGFESDGRMSTGTIRPLLETDAPAEDLDSTTALVLVYNRTCPQCRVNTDNWLRLVADARARNPTLKVVLVASSTDTLPAGELPASLRHALPEYRLNPAGVEATFGTRFVPATIVLRDGRAALVAYGLVGPRRRARIVDELVRPRT